MKLPDRSVLGDIMGKIDATLELLAHAEQAIRDPKLPTQARFTYFDIHTAFAGIAKMISLCDDKDQDLLGRILDSDIEPLADFVSAGVASLAALPTPNWCQLTDLSEESTALYQTVHNLYVYYHTREEGPSVQQPKQPTQRRDDSSGAQLSFGGCTAEHQAAAEVCKHRAVQRGVGLGA